jgi:hypothetical protein
MPLGDLNELSSFSLDQYSGIDREGLSVSDVTREPSYGSIASYPDSLVVGDSLFPMLYIYYMGEASNRNKVGDQNLFDQGIRSYFQRMQSTMAATSVQSDGSSNAAAMLTNNIQKFYRMFTSAVNKNRNFLFLLSNATNQLMARFRARMPQNRGGYYSNESRTRFDYFPVMENQGANNLEACMESLRLLFENGMITYDQDLGIRPLDLYSGGFADVDQQFGQMNDMAKVLGLPTRGVFTINNRPRTDYMFRTFSGIDIIALASLNTVVSRLEGLSQLSWSIHRGMNAQRVIGKPSAVARASGSRTIAGTMVFTLADRHPLLELVPGDYPVTNTGSLGSNQGFWQPLMMPDQLPPFDLMVTMTNEYGYASIVSLYGIQITDEGTVLGIDNLITECVVQYTAVAMDPIMSVQLDENGDIDPYGILQGGYSRMWKHREAVVQGVAYSDLEQAYEAQYDSTFGAVQNRITSARREFAASRRQRGSAPRGESASSGRSS